MKINFDKNKIFSKERIYRLFFLFIAIILFIYILICDVFLTISISVTLTFLVMAVLNFLIYILILYPTNLKERGISFIRVFINVAYLMLFIIFLLLFIFNLTYKKSYLENNESFDYIIVFGAGVTEDDNKNNIINSRIEKAIEYANLYKDAKFILTGSKGKNEPVAEAEYMREYMESRGINETRIMTDVFSNNTNENIENSLYMIKNDVLKRNRFESFIDSPFDSKNKKFDIDFLKIGMISSDFHLTRISMMAKKAGVKKPYNITVKTDSFLIPYYYVRENLSIFKAVALEQINLSQIFE